MKRLLILALLSLGTTFCLHRPQTLLAPKLKTSVNEYQPSAKNLARFMQDPEITNNPIIKNIVILSLLHWDAQIAFAERILEKDPDILLQIYRMLEILKNQHEQRVQEPDYPETSLEKLQSILFTDKAGDQIIVAIQYEARRMLAKKLSCTPGSLEDGTCQPLQPFKDKPYFAKKNWLEILKDYSAYENLFGGDTKGSWSEFADLTEDSSELKEFNLYNKIYASIKDYVKENDGQIVKKLTNRFYDHWIFHYKITLSGEIYVIGMWYWNDKFTIKNMNAAYHLERESNFIHIPVVGPCEPILESLEIKILLECARLFDLKKLVVITENIKKCRKDLLKQHGFIEKKKHFWSSPELIYEF